MYHFGQGSASLWSWAPVRGTCNHIYYVKHMADMGRRSWVACCFPSFADVLRWWTVYSSPWHKRGHDEDINTLAAIIPSVEIVGPITQSWGQQLNHLVNSFLCSSSYNIESQLLPNVLIVLRNQGDDHGGQTEHQEGAGEPRRHAREGGKPIRFEIAEFECNSESRTTLYSNWHPDCIQPPFWTSYICMER
jgi:hypothetical protein